MRRQPPHPLMTFVSEPGRPQRLSIFQTLMLGSPRAQLPHRTTHMQTNSGTPLPQTRTPRLHQRLTGTLRNGPNCMDRVRRHLRTFSKSTGYDTLLYICLHHSNISRQLCEALSLSYKTPGQLNRVIDSLPGQGKFKRDEVVIAGEAFDIFHRDILECIQELFGKPELAAVMKFAPERHYADKDETVRIYSDLHTGRWWWGTQVRCSGRKTHTSHEPD